MEIYIGIDLAWGDKNLSGFAVLCFSEGELKLLDIKLLHSLDAVIQEIEKYDLHNVYIGVDAPLLIPNESGNREIEKNFNRDFSKYKIAMLPVNRKLLSKYSQNIRSEELYLHLSKLGYKRDFASKKTIFEVYPHSTIAVCFNEYKILPYKRKKGRNSEFLCEQLEIYKSYLNSVISNHSLFQTDTSILKGASMKDFEDKLDAVVSAYTLYFCKYNAHIFYTLDGIPTFITPK